MSRVRAINPGFFLDDELADVQPLGRLLFAGLWCIADREGRLKDRPRRIKTETLPYDDCDVNALLEELSTARVIHRWITPDGNRYIAIPSWHKYQNPHYKEAESTIPEPDSEAWRNLASTSGQCWTNVENLGTYKPCSSSSSSSSSSSKDDASLNRKTKKGHCPECRRERFSDTPLTHDESGAHCPICGWRAA